MPQLPFVPYNQSLMEYARQNRNNPTKAEGLLWHVVLKGRGFLGYKFRRQKIINSFILDFYCPQLLFGIEIDGGYHSKKEQTEYDKRRDEVIKKYGIQIVRFTNEEVEKNLKGITAELEIYLNKREKEIQKRKVQRQIFDE